MLYIRCLFKVITSNILKSLLIVIISALSAIFLVQKETSLHLLGLSKDQNLPKISFVTSAEVSFQNLKNKIIVLPGVKLVKHKDSETLKEKISLLFKSDILNEVISEGPQYSKFTIYFKPTVTTKSINLIKSYVIKILSGKEVYFGKVSGIKKDQRLDQSHLFYFVYGMIMLLLLSLYLVFEINLRKVTYLFQRFQRGKALSYKVSFLSFVLLVILPSLIIFFISNDIKLDHLTAFLIPSIAFYFTLNLKKYKWSN